MLKGFIFYCGLHYYSYFWVKVDDEFIWMRFDDTSVTKKKGWEEVVLDSVEDLALPTLIFYEKINEDDNLEGALEKSF